MPKGRVAVLPDFFVDRLVYAKSPRAVFLKVTGKHRLGGGGLHGIFQREMKGGNAVNVAYALGRLGLSTHLIALADEYGEALLRVWFKQLKGVSLDLLSGRQGYTVAFEFDSEGGFTNVMIGDSGDVSTLGPERLGRKQWAAIENSKAVCVFNWAANQMGTILAQRVFERASKKGCLTFFDPSDMTERISDVPSLIDSVLSRGLVKILSVNENEAMILAKALGIESYRRPGNLEQLSRLGDSIHRELDCTVDLHSRFGSSSSAKEGTFVAPSFRVKPILATGAGDVWNAADLASHLMKLDGVERLVFANAASALYISNKDLEPPSLSNLSSFLRRK